MNPLETAAVEMRRYAFAHPFNPLKATAETMQVYRRKLTWLGWEVQVQFTFLSLRTMNVAQLSVTEVSRERDLPVPLVEEIRDAFFHPEDKPTRLPRTDREELYAALGCETGVTKHVEQYLALNPHKD